MSGGFILRRTRALQTDALPTRDARAVELRHLTAVTEDQLSVVREVFAGTGFADDPERVRALLTARAQVNAGWASARTAFLEIGRALNDLGRHLHTKAERDRLTAGFGRLFPLSDSLASQFRRIAEAVDSGRIPAEQCPAAYSVAYQLALLPDEALRAARQRGLVSPSTTRARILEFRRELAAPKPPIREEEQLLEARKRALAELLRIRKRLAELKNIARSSGA